METVNTNVESTKCARCGDSDAPVRAPRLAAYTILPLAWIALFATGAASALLLPLNMILIPCWFACASGVGELARKLLDPKCGSCGEARGADDHGVARRTSPGVRPVHRTNARWNAV